MLPALSLLLLGVLPLQASAAMDMKQVEAQVRQLVAKNMPSVVSLMGESVPAAGSGTIISADGLVLTAAHVTRGNEHMTVIFPDGRSVKCKVLGANYTRDVSLAKIEEPGTYPFTEIGDSDKLEETSFVIAMGHPGGFDLRRTPPVRIGRISLKNQGGFLVSDCTLVGGDSGGPLFDLEGKVVGIHSSISMDLSFNRDAPVNAAKADWDKLLAGERWGSLRGDADEDEQGPGNPRRAVLGAVLNSSSDDGVILMEVRPNSPAAAAGLQAGDRITKFAGAPVKTAAQLRAILAKQRPGKKVALAYQRGEQSAKASLTLIPESEMLQRMAGNGAPEKPGQPDQAGKKELAGEPAKPDFGELLREKLRKKAKGAKDVEITPADLADVLRELLEKQGVAKEKLKGASFPDLIKMLSSADLKAGDSLEPLRDLFASMDPARQQKLNDQFMEMLNGHRPGTKAAAKATVVFRDAKKPAAPRCFGAVVQAEGWVLTKASEVKPAAALQCLVQGKWVDAKLVRTWQEHDLALVKVQAQDLPVIEWSDKEAPAIGSFITAVAPTGADPAAIGVVSVATRSQQKKGRGYLGVQVEADSKGLMLKDVIPGSAAANAGLQKSDRILEVDGQKPDSVFNFTKVISGHKAGETLSLKLQRGEEQMDKQIALGDLGASPAAGGGSNPRADRMDAMGSTISSRRGDFVNIMQTDFPIDANECGGPVTDLDGNTVGLVIARSGRVETMVLPSNTVREVLAQVDFKKEADGLAGPAPKTGSGD